MLIPWQLFFIMDSINANTLTEVTTVPTNKKLIFTDPDTNEGGIITMENLTKQVLQNLTSQQFALDAGQMTIPAALNALNSDRNFFINSQSNTYDNFEAVFNKCLKLSIIGVEKVFCANIKSLESYCIVKFYKRSDDSAKMIVFRYDGITIVDGATNSLLIKSIVAE